MHVLDEHYENSAPSVWTRQIEGEGINPATYEIQLTETELDQWELQTFQLRSDGTRVSTGDKPKTDTSPTILNAVGVMRVGMADSSRKAKNNRQTKNRTITTNKGRTRVIGDGWKA